MSAFNNMCIYPSKLFLPVLCIFCLQLNAQDSTIRYPLPDSIRAVQFLAEINVQSVLTKKKEAFAGIRTDVVSLALEAGDNGKKKIAFRFPRESQIIARGLGVNDAEKDQLVWNYDWSMNENYKLLIGLATDSADNFSVYSGYLWLPKENKWKLLGSCKIQGRWSGIKEPGIFFSNGKKNTVQGNNSSAWIQRSNGSWKYLKSMNLVSPVVLVTNHVDSIQQYFIEKELIEKAIANGKTDVKANVEGVYYSIMKEGSGRPVLVSDTVVAYYKGYLFEDGTIFDQTKETPATFPLRRLIRGWQLGLPLCKVGGKIKLVIPSALAYSIRTRAAKIPPNSILVFEIEVVDTKPAL